MFAEIKPGPDRIARPDADVLADVYEALRAAGHHSSEYREIEADVQEGVVALRGHMHGGINKHGVERRVEAVSGVKAVHSELVADSDLEREVAQALAANQRTRGFVLHVGASEGWIQLGGRVPDAQVRAEAETVAAGVPAVRGVLGLPHVSGGPRNGNRRVLQPRIGATVYADDGKIGKVAGVVIDPRNRLVSHIVVDAHLDIDRRTVRGTYVIPVDAVRLSTHTGTTLHDSAKEVNARPRFGAADFVHVPAGWDPPFPYTRDTVRWLECTASARVGHLGGQSQDTLSRRA